MTRVCIPQNYNELGAQCLAHTDCASGFCSYTDASVPNNGASKFCTIPGQRDLGETCNWASDCDSGASIFSLARSCRTDTRLAQASATTRLARLVARTLILPAQTERHSLPMAYAATPAPRASLGSVGALRPTEFPSARIPASSLKAICAPKTPSAPSASASTATSRAPTMRGSFAPPTAT